MMTVNDIVYSLHNGSLHYKVPEAAAAAASSNCVQDTGHKRQLEYNALQYSKAVDNVIAYLAWER